MRAVIAITVLLVACTKPNPDLCCTDEADCAAQDLPAGSTCAEGLVCRGNQCIAETCADASECDAAAPYCDGTTCVEQCSMDSQCPGFDGSAEDPYCVAGGCVQCRAGMADCSGTTPICDANACRGCAADTDCSSGLCNEGTGACVEASSLLYASPGGSDSADCSEAAPCSITHAIASVTPSLNTIEMAPGTYAAAISITSGATLTLLGSQATLGQRLYISDNSKVTIQDLNITSGLWCYDSSGAPDSELTLVRVLLESPLADGREFKFDHCHLSMSQVTYQDDAPGSDPVLSLLAEATLSADRSMIPVVNFDSLPITATVTITNSLVQAFSLPTTQSNSINLDVSFSTGVGYAWYCPDATAAGVVVHYSNGIIYAPQQLYAATGGNTCFDRVIGYSLSVGTPPTGFTFEDPKLKDPANGDYHLTAGSPAIDAADTSVPDADDYDGVARPQGAGPDIGAFEYH